MKAIGFLTFLPLMVAMPMAFAKSELEILRTRCEEQERQIRQLEEENHRLKGEETPDITASLSPGRTRLISTAPEEKPASSETSGEAADEAKSRNPRGVYTIRKGDSLERIADKLNTTTKTLAKLNGITPDTILHPGQSLKIPGSASAVSKANPSLSSSGSETYRVQQGDTYYSIARKYHITPEALQNINPSVKANAVRPGLVLRLKLPSEKTKSNAEESQKKTEAANKPETKQTVKREPKPLAKQEPKPAAKSESKTTGKSEQSKKDAISFRPVEKHSLPETVPFTPKENPGNSIKPAVSTGSTACAGTTPVTNAGASLPTSDTPKKNSMHTVPVTEKITFGDFAAKHGTTTAKLNELNGLSLSGSTILAEGSELYIPAQP